METRRRRRSELRGDEESCAEESCAEKRAAGRRASERRGERSMRGRGILMNGDRQLFIFIQCRLQLESRRREARDMRTSQWMRDSSMRQRETRDLWR